MRILAVANQKGGTSKTTTAVNVAGCLAASARKVLLIDFDPQASATTWLLRPGDKHLKTDTTLLNLLTSAFDVDVDEDNFELSPEEDRSDVLWARLQNAVVPIKGVDGLDLLPASRRLAQANVILAGEPMRDQRLRMILEAAPDDRWDDVVIDCPPSLEILATNAAIAAHEMLVPVTAELMSVQGVGHLFSFVKGLRLVGANKALKVVGVVTTRYDARQKVSKDVYKVLRSKLGSFMFDTIINTSARLIEVPGSGKPIHLYDPKGRSAKEYRSLTKELLQRRVA